MWYKLLLHTALEPTPRPKTANSTYTTPPPTNLLLHQDWRNESKVSSGGCNEPAEIELRHDPIHVAWVQTTAGKDRDGVHANRRTLYQIANLRIKSGSDFWSTTEDGPACQQHNEKLLLPAETAAIHQAITHNGSIGFPRIKSRGLLQQQQHFLRSITNWHLKYIVLRRLQSVLNALARLITNTRKFDHITPVLKDQFHWLPKFPSASESSSKLQPLFETHSMAVARHISVDPASPSRKSWREPTFVLRHGETSPHLEPRHVASGQEASVSPDRLCGTPCPKTLQIQNCHWNISRLDWKLIYFVWHLPSRAHSAYVTGLKGA